MFFSVERNLHFNEFCRDRNKTEDVIGWGIQILRESLQNELQLYLDARESTQEQIVLHTL